MKTDFIRRWTELRGRGAQSPALGRVSRLVGVTLIALTAANCAQPPQLTAGRAVDPRYGVAPSPRVIAEGEPVPKGGGRKMVGKPYVVAGRVYIPRDNPRYAGEGIASWYGSDFHGRLTANGEIFDQESIAAAHATMPLPSYARVTNLHNRRSLVVRVNDRGPYHDNRIIDVSQRAAEALAFRRDGTAFVRVEYIGKAPLAGSDDRVLMATLQSNGKPASLPGVRPIQIAAAGPWTSLPRASMGYRAAEGGDTGLSAFLKRGGSAAADDASRRRAGSSFQLPPERPQAGTAGQRTMPVRPSNGAPATRSTSRIAVL